MASASEFESLVARFYEPLYQFAFSLTRSEADASDMTQQTFYVWATKGHQLRDATKVKTWLFTTLHRQFLESQRRRVRFPHQELETAEAELPAILPKGISRIDAAHVLATLARVDESYQAAVSLFYIEDCSYQEIADILELPLGTVKSRISRGIGQLQKLMAKEIAVMSPQADRKRV
ncbi:MAG: RNA polymerase sigma factor [Verrucomicrobia bacterium]|nr:RNA polymerase sigma factor [Verrucomicrobiota bacterium]